MNIVRIRLSISGQYIATFCTKFFETGQVNFLISHTSLKSKFLDNRCLLDLYDDVLSIEYLNVTITKRQLKNHRKHQNHIEILLSVSNYEFVESSKHLFLLLQKTKTICLPQLFVIVDNNFSFSTARRCSLYKNFMITHEQGEADVATQCTELYKKRRNSAKIKQNFVPCLFAWLTQRLS